MQARPVSESATSVVAVASSEADEMPADTTWEPQS